MYVRGFNSYPYRIPQLTQNPPKEGFVSGVLNDPIPLDIGYRLIRHNRTLTIA
jgi:hypothetical protein